LIARRDSNLRIIARQTPQRMKHILRVSIDGVRDLFSGSPPVSAEFLARLLRVKS
jgi:hypothetical protein